MLIVPKTKNALTHAVTSRCGVLMGAHPNVELARDHANRLNESQRHIDKLNGPYRVALYRPATLRA